MDRLSPRQNEGKRKDLPVLVKKGITYLLYALASLAQQVRALAVITIPSRTRTGIAYSTFHFNTLARSRRQPGSPTQTMRRTPLFVLIFILLGVPLAARAQTPLQFIAVPPCRVVDTRLPNGPFGGPPIQGETSRDFAIPNGPCKNIPNTAAAYSLNVTVVPQGPLGYLTVCPTGQQQPLVS